MTPQSPLRAAIERALHDEPTSNEAAPVNSVSVRQATRCVQLLFPRRDTRSFAAPTGDCGFETPPELLPPML